MKCALNKPEKGSEKVKDLLFFSVIVSGVFVWVKWEGFDRRLRRLAFALVNHVKA